MYRAVTRAALDRQVDPEDSAALGALARQIDIRFEPGPADAPEAALVYIDDVDRTNELRRPDVGMTVSLVSRVAAVRDAMVALQRALAAEGGVVMLGRDIGTVVLPDAPLKIFLDASPEERARRRYDELSASGRETTLERERAEVAHRDEIDRGRVVSPLQPAADAIVINTGGLSLEQVVERILKLAQCS
jgi:cytidylate kinase